ncbi:MAG: hypothetical protein ACP5N7_01610 [Candidatus Pacearchaeota archaeon]
MKRTIPTHLEPISSARARVYEASSNLDKSRDYTQTLALGEELRASIQNYLEVVPQHVREKEDPILLALVLNHDNIMGAWE